MPPDERPNDLIHWQTEVTVAEMEGAARALRRVGAPFLSATVVAIPDPAFGFRHAQLVRNPDGHVIALTTPRRRDGTGG
jgi:hypothetical protein